MLRSFGQIPEIHVPLQRKLRSGLHHWFLLLDDDIPLQKSLVKFVNNTAKYSLWGIINNFNYLVEMDADFSHQVDDLKKLLEKKSKNSLIIGSRYIPGGNIVGWSKRRETLSKYANRFVKFLSSSKINDSTSGFRVYSKEALKKIDYSKTKSNGYSFQIEMTLIAVDRGVEVLEVPITFLEREIGKSKMNYKIILEALQYLLSLKFKK